MRVQQTNLTNIIDTHVLSRLVYKMVRPLKKKCTKKKIPVRIASPCHCAEKYNLGTIILYNIENRSI